MSSARYLRLRERFPGSGVTLAELSEEMFRLAIASRVSVEFG